MTRNQLNRRGNSNVVVVLVLAVIVLLGLWGLIWVCGSSNVDTPAGYVGYVTQGSVFGKRQFIGTQAGPTSTGKTWKVECTNVSITPYTYDELFNGDNRVLSKDHMQISFAVHVTFRINPDKVKDFVESYSTIESPGNDKSDAIVKDAYANFMKERLRTFARAELERYNWQELSDKINDISQATQEHVMSLTKNTPFDVQSVVVGNIQFPESVAQSVAEAQAATQILQRKEQEVKQAEAEARKKVAEAKGVAEAMEIVQQKLTPQYLQYQAIQAQSAQINSPNHTVIYIPVGPMGVPVAGTFDATTGGAPAQTPAK